MSEAKYEDYYGDFEYRKENNALGHQVSTPHAKDHDHLNATVMIAILALSTTETPTATQLVDHIETFYNQKLNELLKHAQQQGDTYLVPGKDYNLIQNPLKETSK